MQTLVGEMLTWRSESVELTWDTLTNDGFGQGAAMIVVVSVPKDFLLHGTPDLIRS